MAFFAGLESLLSFRCPREFRVSFYILNKKGGWIVDRNLPFPGTSEVALQFPVVEIHAWQSLFLRVVICPHWIGGVLRKSGFLTTPNSFSVVDATSMSSMYSYAKSRPLSSSSVKRWKVWVLDHNVINGNSNRPNGVMIAVWHMSPAESGIWWYAFTRSMEESPLIM